MLFLFFILFLLILILLLLFLLLVKIPTLALSSPNKTHEEVARIPDTTLDSGRYSIINRAPTHLWNG